MAEPAYTLSPPENLARAYATARLRSGFALLLQFDRRIAEIVLREGEPIAAQLRLAWWRDALTGAIGTRPRGEPMLAEVTAIEEQGDCPGLSFMMAKLLDSWSLLVAHEEWSNDVIEQYATERASAVFGGYQRWSGWAGDVMPAGKSWAKNDLAVISGHASGDATGTLNKLPRPLSILAMAARQQRAPHRLSGLRLALHGLTGL